MSLALQATTRLAAAAATRPIAVACMSHCSRACMSSTANSSTAVASFTSHEVDTPKPKSRFSGYPISYGNPNVEPHRAPVSHAPVEYTTKMRVNFALENSASQKTPMEYIDEVPIIEVDGPTAICDGGDPILGHPVCYIQLNKTKPDEPSVCKWCGLRYVMSHGKHHGH